MRSSLFAAIAAVAIASPALGSTYLAHSSFDVDHDDWRVKDTLNGNVTYFTPGWDPTGGVPTGNLAFADVTPGGYIFEAPDEFHGDFSGAVGNGGGFFDWKADMIMEGRRPAVYFWRDGVRLIGVGETGLAPGTWHHIDLVFDMSVDWKIDYGSGAQTATLTELAWVLSDVQDMNITGETWTGIQETTWLDNPTIYGRVPAPGALALLLGAGLAARRRRRD